MSNLEKFRELGISDAVLEALKAKGFEEPSPIQSATIPLLLKGEKDVIGQAQTGTGKTAAFAIPLIETLVPVKRHVQALILAPTRELAVQISEEMNSLKGTNKLTIAPFYGGQDIEIQLRKLNQGIDVVVGTPGRIQDLINRRALNLEFIKFAILDEADEMLNMGFIEDIELILAETPTDKRMLMFSATMPELVMEIAKKFMRDYEIVSVKNHQLTVDLTDQIYFEVKRENKLEALSRIIDMEPDMYAMVFCRTRNDVDELSEKLNNRGYAVEALHGDITQVRRTKIIEQFRSRKFSILIATDVAARGINVDCLTHVINFSIPQGTESYVHRVGRTGRAGRQGTAITFVTPSEFRRLTQIKRETKTDIRKESLPSPKDIVQKKKAAIIEKIASITEKNKFAPYMEFAEELLQAENPAIMLASILRMSFKNELLESSYSEIEETAGKKSRLDRNNDKSTFAERCERTERGRSKVDSRGKARLFVALGKADGYGAGKIASMICDRTGLESWKLGKIECMDKFSFINTSFEDAEFIISTFADAGRGESMLIEMAKPEQGSPRNGSSSDSSDRRSSGRGPRRDFRSNDSYRREGSFRRGGSSKSSSSRKRD